MLRRVGSALALGLGLASAAPAQAQSTECQPDTGITPCIDANSLWLPTGAAHGFALSSPVALARGKVGLAIAAQASFRVLTAELPSPAAEGREVRLIDRVVEENLLLAAGLGRNWELGLALSLILRQSGTGSEGLTSQRGDSLDRTATRDPRLGLSYAAALTPALALKPRLELGLPFGNRAAYASAGGLTFAPALPIEWRLGPLTVGAELALRLRRAVELGSVRWGSQAATTLGLYLSVLAQQRLGLGAELFLLPSLVSATSARSRAFSLETRVLPAEWLASVRARPHADEPWTVALGLGAALALSSEASAAGTRHFVAPTGPGLRVLAQVRYAPVE